MISLEIKNLIKQHAKKHQNEEVCGLIIENKDKYYVIRCKNISYNKQYHSILDPIDYIEAGKIGKIVGTYHSQENDSPSLIDNINANNHNIFSIIYCWKNEKFYIIRPKLIPYLYRDFEIGKYDCFSLIKNYYKQELNININNYDRDNEWYFKNSKIISENFKKEGFIEIEEKDIKLHDILLFGNNKNEIFHMAIYLNNNIMIHHPRNNKSVMEDINIHWKNKLISIVRYKTLF